MATISKGQIITFHCSASLEDGTCLDDPQDAEPYVMAAGTKAKEVFRTAISNALVGMSVNETKNFRVPPVEAFGDVDKAKVVRLPMASHRVYHIGDPIQLNSSASPARQVAGTIVSKEGNIAFVDTNHPLAGKSILLTIQILAVER